MWDTHRPRRGFFRHPLRLKRQRLDVGAEDLHLLPGPILRGASGDELLDFMTPLLVGGLLHPERVMERPPGCTRMPHVGKAVGVRAGP